MIFYHSPVQLLAYCLMISSSSSIRSCRSLVQGLSSSSSHHPLSFQWHSHVCWSTTTSRSRISTCARSHKNIHSTKNEKEQSVVVVVWFRDHALRIQDNLALFNAINDNRRPSGNHDVDDDDACWTSRGRLIPVFLWPKNGGTKSCSTDSAGGQDRPSRGGSITMEKTGGGTAKDVFVVNALQSLNATLNGNLSVGMVENTLHDTVRELTDICQRVNANKVYYLKSHKEKEESILEMKLKENGIVPVSFGGSFSLIDYTRHRVPWKEIVMEHPWRSPLIPFVEYVQKIMDEMPKKPVLLDVSRELNRYLVDVSSRYESSSIVSKPCIIDDLKSTVGRTAGGTNWGESISRAWPATEEDANNALTSFLDSLKNPNHQKSDGGNTEVVVEKRTHLASRLSPYLARGLISPGQVYQGIKSSLGDDIDVDSFLRRICWRDYTYAAVHLYPKVLHGEPIRDGYEELQHGIPMEKDEQRRRLKRWKEGKTGFPLIDAGMRQLAKEGWMPQKVRLACSTFLVEGLGLSWKDGMQHFAEYLVDFDESINSNMWQNAGCVGLDPYYVGMNYKRRMYWDRNGDYVRTWCPELDLLPDSVEIDMRKTSKVVDCLYEPWMSPEHVLDKAGVVMGKTYPHRVCNDRETRSTFFSRVRDIRLKWPATKIDAQKRDLVCLGSAGYVGLFTPRALQIRESSVYSSN